MSPQLHMKRSRRGATLVVAAALLVVGAAVWTWAALRVGPAPEIVVTTDRPVIGSAATVTARFSAPTGGLGAVRLELQQGERTALLGERRFARPGAFAPWHGAVTGETTLEAAVGSSAQPWLQEGQAVLRATADRMAGPLRTASPVVVESPVAVRLRPPTLRVVSTRHYVRQGGSGAVVFAVGEGAERSGVRAGTAEFSSFPLPGGAAGDRFALFGVPHDLGDRDQVVLFAEDAAGNRHEQRFLDLFKDRPERTDRIELTDAFLERVVPAIAAATPGFDASGSLLDQYLRINGQLRKANLAEVVARCRATREGFLWRGAFLQLPNSQKRAGFAEPRDYVYRGATVDHQTHLGLDLASTAAADVAATNAGVVAWASFLGIYGNAVIVDHGYGLATLVGHLSEIAVEPGEEVKKGQRLGATGTTGLAGGDHLHLEVLVQGRAVDPVEWLDGHWITDNIGSKLALPAEVAGQD